MNEQERRRFGRIDLERPLAGMIGEVPVSVVEVAVGGFRTQHEGRFSPGHSHQVRIDWEVRPMRFVCQVVRCTLFRLGKQPGEPTLFQTGLKIEEAIDQSDEILRELIGVRVLRALEEQKANARGLPPLGVYTYQVGKGDRFRRCELHEGVWRKFDTKESKQPTNGFTISADIDLFHVEMLCRTYESTTEEGRRLTRMLAELSVAKSEGTPVRRYIP